MTALRWWLFQKISRFGWWICPEPHRSQLYQGMRFDPNWKNALPEIKA
jgi:hypothetical protein